MGVTEAFSTEQLGGVAAEAGTPLAGIEDESDGVFYGAGVYPGR